MVRKLAGHRDCDLCGKPADEYYFALGSRRMRVVDLCERCQRKLEKLMQPYVAASRRPRRTESQMAKDPGRKPDPEYARIRAWAKLHGYPVGRVGAISNEVRRAYYNSLE